MNAQRKIIEIDEERCNGCGQCVLDCAEGAIAIVDGKARVISESYCDGLGACLQGCPQNALRIVERPAAPFDEEAVRRHLSGSGRPATPFPVQPVPAPSARGCPGAMARSLTHAGRPAGNWPIKLRLVPPGAPFLRGAHLLVTADCAPAVFPGFQDMARNKVVLTVCPKFEDVEALTRKLTEICAAQEPSGCTSLRMEVPCCRSLERLAGDSVRQAGAPCSTASLCVGCDGRPVSGF